jgi:hypothetical protein
LIHHLVDMGDEPDRDLATLGRTREIEVNLALPSIQSGCPQRVGKGCPGNCHLNRLVEVQDAEHGKFPEGC